MLIIFQIYLFFEKNLLSLAKNPFSLPGIVISIFSPKILFDISKYAFPDGAFLFCITGSPLFVCVMIYSSSGTTPS